MVRDYTVNDAAFENAGKCYGMLKFCCVFTFLLQNVLKFIQFIKLVSLSSSLFCPVIYRDKIYVAKLNWGMFSQNNFSNCNLLFEICGQYVKYNVHLLIEVISSHLCGCIHSQITASVIGCLTGS